MSEEKLEPSFVKKDSVSASVECRLREHFFSATAIISSTYDPKHITECPRRMLYRCKGTNYNTGGINKREQEANRNRIWEWITLFRACKGIRVHDTELSVSDCKYNLVGKLDFVIGIKDTLLATVVHSVDNDSFLKIQEKGAIRKDVIELMVYMWLTELSDGLIIYENRNNFEYTTFHIKPYKPIINSVIKKCKMLDKHEVEATMPDRPYKTKDESECIQCEYWKECWQLANKQEIRI